MVIKYYGHSCFLVTFSDGTRIVTDPFDEHITYAPCDAECDAALVSHHHMDHCYTETLKGSFAVFDTPGNRKIGSVSVSAMPTWHDHHNGAHRGNNLMFRIIGDDLSIAHLGDLGHIPTPEQVDFLKDLDILMIPVGGNYTIDHSEAAEIVRMLNPRVTIAMHYRTPANNDFRADTQEPFAADTGAVQMPRVIDITPETLNTMPKVFYMDYE